MRILLLAVLLALAMHAVQAFIKFPSISFPMCKKSCKSDSDCKSSQRCIKISICKKKICFVKLTIKPPTTRTTTTTTGTTAIPATVALPPNTCSPPARGELVSYRCSRGHKKDATCFMSCKNGYCPSSTTLIICRCKSGKCSWSKNLSNTCRLKNPDECKTSRDCAPAHTCIPQRCERVCKKFPKPPNCPNRCTTSSNCPVGEKCVQTKCGTQCETTDLCSPAHACKSDFDCKIGTKCTKTLCGLQCKRIVTVPPDFHRCPLPCSANRRCADGYICEKQILCGLTCVRKRVPSCAVFNPTSNLKPTTYCLKLPKLCFTDTTCGENEICCYSTVCRTSTCQEKVNNCRESEIEKCFTDADCSPEEKCIIYEGGCKKCSKGFYCPTVVNACNKAEDCKSPIETCSPAEDGCRTCSISSIRPSLCSPAYACKSDSGCKFGTKCTKTLCGLQCKRIENGGPGTGVCFNPCSATGICPPGKVCVNRACGKECIQSLTVPPDFNRCPLPCSANRRCTDGYICEKQICGLACVRKQYPIRLCIGGRKCLFDKNCTAGEKCVTESTGCKVCQTVL